MSSAIQDSKTFEKYIYDNYISEHTKKTINPLGISIKVNDLGTKEFVFDKQNPKYKESITLIRTICGSNKIAEKQKIEEYEQQQIENYKLQLKKEIRKYVSNEKYMLNPLNIKEKNGTYEFDKNNPFYIKKINAIRLNHSNDQQMIIKQIKLYEKKAIDEYVKKKEEHQRSIEFEKLGVYLDYDELEYEEPESGEEKTPKRETEEEKQERLKRAEEKQKIKDLEAAKQRQIARLEEEAKNATLSDTEDEKKRRNTIKTEAEQKRSDRQKKYDQEQLSLAEREKKLRKKQEEYEILV